MLDISTKAGTPVIIDGPVQINTPRQVHNINVSDESPLNRLPYRSLNNTTSPDECCEPIEEVSNTEATDDKATKDTTKGYCIKCFLSYTDLGYIVTRALDAATFDTQKDDILPQGVCVACCELEADLLRVREYEPSQRPSRYREHEDPQQRPLSALEHDLIFRSFSKRNNKGNNPNIRLSNQILRKMQKYITKSIPRKIAYAVRISSIYYDQSFDEKWYYMYLEAFENVPLFADQSFIDLYYPEDGDYLVVSATGQIHTLSPDRLCEEYEILTGISQTDKINEMLYIE